MLIINCQIASLTEGRDSLTVAIYENEMFAISGCRYDILSSSVERYDEQENEWIKIESLNCPRIFATVAIIEDFKINKEEIG